MYRKISMPNGAHAPSVVSAPRYPWLTLRANNLWVRFFLRRTFGLALVLATLVVAVFMMVHLIPGDPVTTALGVNAQPSIVARIRHENGFDRPLVAQFTLYVTRLLHGDLGHSFITDEPVSNIIRQRIGSSLQLASAALVLVLVLSIPLGLATGATTREGRHRRFELAFTSIASVLASIPDYLTGTVLAFLFAVQFRLLPVSGSGSLATLVLPALAISMGPTMSLARIVRLETLNVLAQDYIRTARSQRLPALLIYLRHALPNVLSAALTIGGVLFANIIGGTVIVENVFARPGLGTALTSAVIGREYVVVQGITLVLGLFVVVLNTCVDVTLAVLDPRSLARRG
jgi:peptide/nickel transport system permease protein